MDDEDNAAGRRSGRRAAEQCIVQRPPRTALAVVVVTYSPGVSLAAFLDSLGAATSRPYSVVLADNGSADGVPEAAARDRTDVALVRTGANLGYGAAANVGAAASISEWLVVANPDVAWDPDSLDELIAVAGRWPRAGALGPMILTGDGSVYPSARALPSLGRGIGHALCGWWWSGNPWTRAYRRERGEPVEGPAGWLSGACLLLRREAFESIGGFDASYFMYFEDLDLCERLGRAGWQCIYAPSATVVHSGGHATRTAGPAMVAEHHRSAYRYLSRRYVGVRWLPLRLALRLGLGARSALSRVIGQIGESPEPTRGGVR